jgi:hypothetical protein
MQGDDLSGALRQPVEPLAPRDVLVEQPKPTGHGESVDVPWEALLTDDGWKYVTLEGRPWLMFNLAEDPYELADHAHDPAYRRVRDRLARRMAELKAKAAAGATAGVAVP